MSTTSLWLNLWGVISAKIQVVFEGRNSPLKLGKF